jgi:putative ABC transport system substrate-binding protein
MAGDPVGTGLVASLARPGGNVTGLSNYQSDVAAKRLELLREVVPGLRRLAILANVGNPNIVLEMTEVETTARTLGLEVVTSEIRRAEDIAPAVEALKGRAEALYACSDFLIFTNRIRINTLALAARLPTIYGEREVVEAGGLMSYGPHFPAMFRRAADYVDKMPTMWTRFCAGRSRATSRSSSPRSSSSSSILRPPRRSASQSRNRSYCVPTR